MPDALLVALTMHGMGVLSAASGLELLPLVRGEDVRPCVVRSTFVERTGRRGPTSNGSVPTGAAGGPGDRDARR
jgi:hypothetical protein